MVLGESTVYARHNGSGPGMLAAAFGSPRITTACSFWAAAISSGSRACWSACGGGLITTLKNSEQTQPPRRTYIYLRRRRRRFTFASAIWGQHTRAVGRHLGDRFSLRKAGHSNWSTAPRTGRYRFCDALKPDTKRGLSSGSREEDLWEARPPHPLFCRHLPSGEGALH